MPTIRRPSHIVCSYSPGIAWPLPQQVYPCRVIERRPHFIFGYVDDSKVIVDSFRGMRIAIVFSVCSEKKILTIGGPTLKSDAGRHFSYDNWSPTVEIQQYELLVDLVRAVYP